MNPKPKLILTAREKLMRSRYTRLVEWKPNWWVVSLKIRAKSFLIGEFGTMGKANRSRDRLAVALAGIEL